MEKISKVEFEQFSVPRMMPEGFAPWDEIEWYKASNLRIAAITKDNIDNDFGFVIFEKGENGQFVFFDNSVSIASKNEAIQKLHNKMCN